MITDAEQNTIQDFLRLTRSMRGEVVTRAITEALEGDHRTNQQGFWRTIQGVAKLYAENDATCGHDARNEGAREFCKQITALDCYMPYI